MISRIDLRKRAKAKLKDAEILYQNNRFDGAVYLSGYVMELILKSRTCKTLNWQGFPETNREFENFKSFKTHNLDILLALTGIESKIKINYFLDWNNVNQWNPEIRYSAIGSVTQLEAQEMISSIKNLMKVI